MNLLKFFGGIFIFLSLYAASKQILVLKSRRNAIKSGVVLPLTGMQDFTICARFNLYQFYEKNNHWKQLFGFDEVTLFGRMLMLPDQGKKWIEMFGKKWEPFGLVGYCYLDGKINAFSIRIMGEDIWNHVCIIIENSYNNTFKIVLNEQLVYEDKNFSGNLFKISQNLSIMGYIPGKDLRTSFPGQITDVNIWNRSLTNVELQFQI